MESDFSAESRYQEILKKISDAASAAGRNPSSVTLIAVSKKQPVEKIEELYRLGHRDFGENYVQELIEKSLELEKRGCHGIRWHFIGHLQTNKAKALLPHILSVHSIDSEKLARVLARQCSELGRPSPLAVFIEVNISRENSKSGIDPQDIERLSQVVSTLPELTLQGLMAIPAASSSETELRSRFRELRELESKSCNASAHRLSMGMSGDFELAISEGATHIRVGTALFGPRS